MADTSFTEGAKVLKPGKGGKGGTGLKKVMFGLPAWAWLIIIAVAIGLAIYIRSQSAADESVGDETYTDPNADDYATDYEEPSDAATGTDSWDDFDDYDPETDTSDKEADPDITLNIYGGKKAPGSTTGKGNCGRKPSNPAGDGYHWKCQGTNWVRAKNSASQNAKQDKIIKQNQAKKKAAAKKKQNNNHISVRAGTNQSTIVGGGPPKKKAPKIAAGQGIGKKAKPKPKPKPKPKKKVASGLLNKAKKVVKPKPKKKK